ncbi:TfoX/Sxy family protein [Albimonas sp. CAU 1670]|uniref:TfoX/Sxy family protein n=1 Tax=Albimonas sp. CAU 1670 TaxID=3032599 RepID=UPI0023D9A4D7|nr:TfoX/Sxy family protein [Albimonas sp. CAU 1670]MDF2231565.1 TfoX/Sxy family protein [Albimonas sp. CAU 1670]
MAVNPDLADWASDMFGQLGEISVKAMFGGAGIYCDGVMFALIGRDDEIYLKAEGVLASALRAGGSTPFTYTRDGAARTMGYWRIPEDGLDDPEEACMWASRSLDIARAAQRG